MIDREGLGRIAANLETMAKAAESTRTEALFGEEIGLELCPPLAEQHALLAIAALETAERHFRLAALLTKRGE